MFVFEKQQTHLFVLLQKKRYTECQFYGSLYRLGIQVSEFLNPIEFYK